MIFNKKIIEPCVHSILHDTPKSANALAFSVISAHVQSRSAKQPVLFVARDETRMAELAACIEFFMKQNQRKEKPVILPSWDCLPYDRTSPHAHNVARRLESLSRLSAHPPKTGRIIMTTINAITQRLPPCNMFAKASSFVCIKDQVKQAQLIEFFINNGYRRATTVREPGEFAVRGGILDIYPPGEENPLRLDFFGDEVESIRTFDALSQRTIAHIENFALLPVSEILMTRESIACFRHNYRTLFGGDVSHDPLFEAVGEGRRPPGLEHWLPLFYEKMETIFDWLKDMIIVLDYQIDEAVSARFDMIEDHYKARLEDLHIHKRNMKGKKPVEENIPPYRPVPMERMYLTPAEWKRKLLDNCTVRLSEFSMPDMPLGDGVQHFSFGVNTVMDFAPARVNPEVGLFEAVIARAQGNAQKATIIAAHSHGAGERLKLFLTEAGANNVVTIENWYAAGRLKPGSIALAILPIDRGFETSKIIIYSEQDILGERLARPSKKRRRSDNFITELSGLHEGDLVVHTEHGIARYDGLETLQIEVAPHDCLRLIYAGDDKLYVPVENLEVLSRYGSQDSAVALDKLGGVAWQARKARMKKRVREIADGLLKIAAKRELGKGEILLPPQGAFDEFCARFGFVETDDQLKAVEDIISDFSSGRPMDRLICGDVGFGKTEVALRATFIAVLAGLQVVVVVPTTLLARQHYMQFKKRFEDLPVCVEQLSRLVAAKKANEIRQKLAEGQVDIIIGTHAVLAKSVTLKHLGLLIIDEEQHFGVQQKEALKKLKHGVHVLTLTATPIPRTLQMALAGVREMSLIATPPVDRLAIRTFVLPYDPVALRETIRRERYRGGQVFYVCPRLADLDGVREKLKELASDARVAVAHGQLPPRELEEIMCDFTDGKYDILVSTNIVESGLDIPNANTMIIHRADMFGLAQLYQLRGRIGRGKQRAWCYLTLPAGKPISDSAGKRLEAMQALDHLGAGFSLASHDLEIRGAGNLVGEEQSGHIKEVGIELYQRMLEEAVVAARENHRDEITEESWSPHISIGCAIMIPEEYVTDLSVRMALYRRISCLESKEDNDNMAIELTDRFGKMPNEVKNLLQVIEIKQFCKKAGIEKLETGLKGTLVTFRHNYYANPQGLIRFVQKMAGSARLRPDHKLVITRSWEDSDERIKGVRRLAEILAKTANNL